MPQNTYVGVSGAWYSGSTSWTVSGTSTATGSSCWPVNIGYYEEPVPPPAPAPVNAMPMPEAQQVLHDEKVYTDTLLYSLRQRYGIKAKRNEVVLEEET